MRTLSVKKHKMGYGITDGKLWFFYAYQTKEAAEKILPRFDTSEKVRVNISRTEPMQVA